jgi:hypothetical protein
MLKSSLIFRKSSAHLIFFLKIEKDMDCRFSKFECFEHVYLKKIVSNFEHVHFPINK